MCAELVYGELWKNSAEPDCAYYQSEQKCKCKKHKVLRQNVKSVNFGLAFGMTEDKLSKKLDISKKEAKELIDKYFTVFPDIQNFLITLASYGVHNGKIKTFRPYKRVRYFPNWSKEMLNDYDYWKKDFGEIERESRNTPIQGSGANVTKEALYLILKEVYTTNIPVKVVMQVHDSVDTICHKDYAETWKVRLKELMEQAALSVIPEGLLKADVGISDVWTKD